MQIERVFCGCLNRTDRITCSILSCKCSITQGRALSNLGGAVNAVVISKLQLFSVVDIRTWINEIQQGRADFASFIIPVDVVVFSVTHIPGLRRKTKTNFFQMRSQDFTSKKIFPLSLFYAFLDVLCYPECLKKFSPKIFLGEARRDTMLPSISSFFNLFPQMCGWVSLPTNAETLHNNCFSFGPCTCRHGERATVHQSLQQNPNHHRGEGEGSFSNTTLDGLTYLSSARMKTGMRRSW